MHRRPTRPVSSQSTTSSTLERRLHRRRRRDMVAPPPCSPPSLHRLLSLTGSIRQISAGADRSPCRTGGATVLDDLPEVIIREILVRLPPKDVLRCRAVRKSWRRAASTRKFMLEHHGLQPSLPVIDALDSNSRLVLTLRDGAGAAGASSQKLRPFLRCTGCNVILHAVCDGLLIVSKHSTISICNPATSACARLPLPPVRSGFCPDAVGFCRKRSGEYRVLYLVCRRFSADYRAASFYVLAEGSEQARRIGWPRV